MLQISLLLASIVIAWEYQAHASSGQGPGKTLSADHRLLWEQVRSLRLPTVKLSESQRQLALVGKKLFFDRRFSATEQHSCAHCHRPEQFFTDGLPQGLAIGKGERNTPSIINSAAKRWLFWDGRADSLPSQALGPIEHPLEHGFHRMGVAVQIWTHYRHENHLILPLFSSSLSSVFERLKSLFLNDPGSPRLAPVRQNDPIISVLDSRQMKAKGITKETRSPRRITEQLAGEFRQLSPEQQVQVNQSFVSFGKAIAAYERAIVSEPSPFDRFLDRWKGQGAPEKSFQSDFQETQFSGLKLFVGKASCVLCHNGPYFSDEEFHHVGFPHLKGDRGRIDGLATLTHDQFQCDSPYFKDDPEVSQSEICQEKKFINKDSPSLVAAFKTPTLRHVMETAPYGHAGQFTSLQEVVEHYNRSVNLSPIGHMEESLKPLNLSPKEIESLVSFLQSLSSPWTDLTESR